MTWRDVLQLMIAVLQLVRAALLELRRPTDELDALVDQVAARINGDDPPEAPDVRAGKRDTVDA